MSINASSGSLLINGPLDDAPKTLITLVNDAVDRVAQQGEAVFCEFRLNDSPWRGRGAYIFVLDLRGNVLVHPDPSMEGTNQLHFKKGVGNPTLKKLIRAFSAMSEKKTSKSCYAWTQKTGLLPQLEECYVSMVQAPSGNCFLIGSGIDAKKTESIHNKSQVDQF